MIKVTVTHYCWCDHEEPIETEVHYCKGYNISHTPLFILPDGERYVLEVGMDPSWWHNYKCQEHTLEEDIKTRFIHHLSLRDRVIQEIRFEEVTDFEEALNERCA